MHKHEKNIVLIGMRGTGKSAVGAALAAMLDWPFCDIDHEIEKNEGSLIPAIVQTHGWEYFRDLESQHTARIAKIHPAVIATGGGVVLREKNISALKKHGVLVLIKSPIAQLAARIAKSNRPSLTGKNPADELATIWHERRSRYETAADATVIFDFESEDKESDLTKKAALIRAAVQSV